MLHNSRQRVCSGTTAAQQNKQSLWHKSWSLRAVSSTSTHTNKSSNMHTYPMVVGCAEDGRVVQVVVVGVDVLLKAYTQNGQMGLH